jgi:hypothetical protein
MPEEAPAAAHATPSARTAPPTPQQRPETGAVVDDLNDLFGVDAGQMIAARETADTALARGDVEALAAALERMGVPAEDNPALLAQAVLALPPAVQRRQLDRIGASRLVRSCNRAS